jgi:hypothetical protein
MNPTHERIPRRAECLQWDGENSEAVIELLLRGGLVGGLFRECSYILAREDGRVKCGISRGQWVLMGEDGKIRVYSDDEFKVMYRRLNCGHDA